MVTRGNALRPYIQFYQVGNALFVPSIQISASIGLKIFKIFEAPLFREMCWHTSATWVPCQLRAKLGGKKKAEKTTLPFENKYFLSFFLRINGGP